MTDKGEKAHPVILAMARAMAGYDLGYDAAPASYRIEHAKAAAKVLIEECAKIVERGMGFHTQVDEILESAATAIRALSSEMDLEG